MHDVVIFEHGVSDLSPLTDLRPACCVRTGAFTLLERLRGRLKPTGLRGQDTGDGLASEVSGLASGRPPSSGRCVLLINGRTVVPPPEVGELAPGSALVERGSGVVVAACLDAVSAEAFLNSGKLGSGVSTHDTGACLLHRSWDVIRHRDRAVGEDLRMLCAPAADAAPPPPPPGVTTIGPHPIVIHETAKVSPSVVLDAAGGPIHIGANATVRPMSVIVGPAFIGEDASVLEHALIKGHTAIGPACKVAGEVAGVIFQGFANKAHDGHLGDSWVGQWVNLGAGTTNSNLLNTYSSVMARPAPGARHEDTGLLFLGAILGDHTKTAICTRLMTASIIGTGCNIASTKPPPSTLERFTWLTDDREQTFRLNKFFDIARTVMARRGQTPTPAYEARLTALHASAGAG